MKQQTKYFRPLGFIANAMSTWARQGNVQSVGRIRAAVDHFGIALGWMAKGFQYDTRTFWQRLTDKSARWHFKHAARALVRGF